MIHRHQFIIGMCVILFLSGVGSLYLSNVSHFSFHQHIENICNKLSDIKKMDDNDLKRKISEIVALELETLHKITFWKSFLQHFSIALFLSVILISVVELHTRERFHREAGEDVLFAVLKKQIPDSVFIEIQDHILRSPYFRKDWHYEFSFKGHPYEDLNKNMIIYELLTSWTIKNISSEKIPYNPVSVIFNHPRAIVHDNSGNEIHLSRHKGIWIHGDPVLNEEEIEKIEKDQREKDQILLKANSMTLAPNQEIRISMSREEVSDCPGVGVWAISGYSENLTVTIKNEASGLLKPPQVNFLHPKHENLIYNAATKEWRYEGGILPYQGIRLSWDRL